ncbi:hypothetical protein BDA96_03G051500 [Sorghum bicolor]|jgi:hypothetical protein|uniref:Uncharacterized protein n=2 Tax=Sorghum bicolor TaxID=4558 RepID=A0A921RAI6_SORBI|nr:hypothetical protein SORBI_3003G048300 [Sorghum bicolor]KAG0536297.1 hypothetical protein BDA96_03G051500 [Sorghum bicolor]
MSFPLAQLALGRRERHLMEAATSGGKKSLRSTWPVQYCSGWLLHVCSVNAFAFFHERGKKELCMLATIPTLLRIGIMLRNSPLG